MSFYFSEVDFLFNITLICLLSVCNDQHEQCYTPPFISSGVNIVTELSNVQRNIFI